MRVEGANSRSWHWALVIGVAALVGLQWGCASTEEQMGEHLKTLGERRVFTTVQGNMEATGGMGLWARVKQLEATAISTVFEEAGAKTLIEQHFVVRPFGESTIESRSVEPSGVLTERMDRYGKAEVLKEGAMTAEEAGQEPSAAAKVTARGAALKLRLLAEGLLGATALLREDYTVRYGALEQQGGRSMHKIEVTGALLNSGAEGQAGRPGDLLVIWVDAETMLYDRMWLRYHLDGDAFGYMAVLLDEYEATPEGLVLPRSVSFVRSDKYQQFSERRILLVELEKADAMVSEKARGEWGLGSLFSW